MSYLANFQASGKRPLCNVFCKFWLIGKENAAANTQLQRSQAYTIQTHWPALIQPLWSMLCLYLYPGSCYGWIWLSDETLGERWVTLPSYGPTTRSKIAWPLVGLNTSCSSPLDSQNCRVALPAATILVEIPPCTHWGPQLSGLAVCCPLWCHRTTVQFVISLWCLWQKVGYTYKPAVLDYLCG